MKNTDYKDVLDIGNEALSMDNKFSFPVFPSLKTAFTTGENIRGMNNVSPLATVKLFNQSTEDLQTKYYPDGNPPVEGTFTYIPDNRSDLTSVIKTTVKDFYYYGVKDVKNFAFKVIIFSSTETTKLKECFEVSSPKGREILIFVEDNSTDNVSGTYGAIKISEDVLTFLNSKKRLAYDVYDNTEIYKEIKAVVPELTDDQIKSLLQKGYIEDTRIGIAKTYFKVASFFSSGISLIHPSLGILTNDAMRAATSSVLEKIIETIEESRLEENRWQPKPARGENGTVDESYQYKPLISPGKNGSGTVNFTEISQYLKTMLTEQNGFVKSLLNIKKDFKQDSQPNGLLEILYKSYLDAYYIMDNVVSNLGNISDLEILKYGTKVYNALLCGIWNGLIDAVSGIFAMVKMIYDGITLGKDFAQNIEKYLPTLLEQFDEAIQAIKNIDFTEIVKYIYGKLKEIKLTFNPIACGYFIGYAYGFIISLLIEIIVGTLVSGGTLSIPIIIQKLEETIFGIFRLGWGLIKGIARKIRTFSKFVVKSIKNIIEGFQELLRFLKGEKGNFKRIVDEVFESNNIKKIGQYGGKILSEAEIEDWAKLVKKKFGTTLLKIDRFDDPNVLASFDPNTNTIKYTDNVTEYFMSHEHYHAEEMHKIGFEMYVRDAPLAGVLQENYTTKNWINRYKREKYVYDQLVKNAEKFNLNNDELYHAFIYFDVEYVIQLEIRNIKIPK
ncbi:zincin-like metallopeptidase toxin domain-containing protein [Chryseobacterium sp. M5A1_1a]